ncbi:hypothetical protein OPV22_028165 [Ensete ventricosum]|uniref:Uncharacterized protein n=1 Tax=Ensete ventricosum TaxID=4639 RepID=A0AAV8Q5M6_ENSVE|nr:hypothetical protein OPV22_028165 [Ensete ventricosum]
MKSNWISMDKTEVKRHCCIRILKPPKEV